MTRSSTPECKRKRNIIIIMIRIFTSVLADGLSLEFEWQQVPPPSLQHSSRYSDRSQQCCSDGSIRPLIPKPSCPLINPLVTVPNVSITISITVTFKCHSLFVFFFSFLARSKYLSLFCFFQFYSVVSWNGKVHYSAYSLYLFWL